MQYYFITIIISVATGVIAGGLFDIIANVSRNRRNIDFNLEIILDLIRHFENSIEFNHYDLAMSQIDRIIDKIGLIYDNINFYTYFPKIVDKKLILTILYNLQCFCKIIKNISIGENNLENEKITRCNRIKNRYLLNTVKNKSRLELSVEFAKNANLGISTKTFLKQNNITPEIAKDLIYIKIFNYAKHSKYETKFTIFTEKDYEKYIYSNSK